MVTTHQLVGRRASALLFAALLAFVFLLSSSGMRAQGLGPCDNYVIEVKNVDIRVLPITVKAHFTNPNTGTTQDRTHSFPNQNNTQFGSFASPQLLSTFEVSLAGGQQLGLFNAGSSGIYCSNIAWGVCLQISSHYDPGPPCANVITIEPAACPAGILCCPAPSGPCP